MDLGRREQSNGKCATTDSLGDQHEALNVLSKRISAGIVATVNASPGKDDGLPSGKRDLPTVRVSGEKQVGMALPQVSQAGR